MICKKIKLRNYRNVKQAEVELFPCVNYFYGENAQGKTNLLEAIYIFARGRSFRTAHDTELISHGEKFSSIGIEFEDINRKQNIEILYTDDGIKKCRKNGVGIGRVSELIGEFRAVLFCPDMLEIVKDGPSVRRSFLDIAISQIKPLYLVSLQKYKNLLNQRNALLKDYDNFYKNKELFYVFAEQLSDVAQTISAEREKYISLIDGKCREYFSDMTGGFEKPKISYGNFHTKEEFYKLFTDNLEKERKYGISLYGPHKDDFDILLNDYPAKEYCSQGQQRSLSLALKIGEGDISKELSGEYPVFLFDDILSELDDKRREYLMKNLGQRQIIMSSCEKISADVAKYWVINGTYTRVK